jgi:hypothetical protein
MVGVIRFPSQRVDLDSSNDVEASIFQALRQATTASEEIDRHWPAVQVPPPANATTHVVIR